MHAQIPIAATGATAHPGIHHRCRKFPFRKAEAVPSSLQVNGDKIEEVKARIAEEVDV